MNESASNGWFSRLSAIGWMALAVVVVAASGLAAVIGWRQLVGLDLPPVVPFLAAGAERGGTLARQPSQPQTLASRPPNFR